MKNFYSILLVLLMSTISYAQVVNIPDANFKNYLLLNSNINTNNDSEIQVSEANSYANTLNVSGLNISDLTGIEAFINIPALTCGNNNLTTLNLVNNTALTSLICFNNQLTSLDITNNTLLTYLSIGTNYLSVLNTTNNPNLETIYCSINNFSSLDFSNNLNLQNLYCSWNPLLSINVTNNTALKILDCSSSNLPTIDLTNNTLLTEFYCNDNNLTSINVANNTQLTKLHISNNSLLQIDISNNTNLLEVFCDNNSLLNIDITNNSSITKLKCNANDLRVLYLKNANNNLLFEMNASSNPNLTCIEVDDASNANMGAFPYSIWVKDATASYSDNCSPCVINVPDTNFKNYLLSNLSININGDNEIQCDEATNYTGGIDINNLSVLDLTGLEQFTALTQLNCSNNSLSSLDVSANTMLTNLVCRYNNIESLDLSNHPNLTTFKAYSNSLTYLNLKNGNNSILTDLNTDLNPTLTCIEVDDPTNANAGNGVYGSWVIDANSSYSAICSTCIVSIPDAIFKSYLVGNSSINTNSDAEIQCTEAQAYTGVIGVNNLGISDLTGLETFINITALYCQNNNLSVLDITNNTQLGQLACNGNNLTSLDLTNATSITDLLCDNNVITSIDITNLTNLTTLNCSNNKLANLNLKNGSNTILTTLDATNNETLSCIEVDNATDATAGNGSYVTWQKDTTASYSEDCNTCVVFFADGLLKNILVGRPLINTNGDTEIQCNEASSYTGEIAIQFVNLPDLTGIEAFTSMTSLNCQNTNVATLPLPNSNNLQSLNCRDNLLTTLDVSSRTNLAYLNCSNNNLTSLDVTNNVLLTQLHISDNNLSSIDITNNLLLTKITFNNINISTLDVSNNTLLNDLGCENNNLTSLDVTGIPNLQVLSISNNNISNIDISTNTALIGFWCDNNNISSIDITNNTLLTALACAGNSLTSLNLKNGNYSILNVMNTTNNPNLTCIDVDNVSFSNANWTNIDPQSYFSIDCSASITYVPDNNFEQALIDLGYDTVLDDFVTTANIDTVTNLDISNENIANLTGIEDFVALTTLNCSNNSLVSLDVSANPNLTELDCNTNLLTLLNVANGNNTNFVSFNALTNPNLTCIEVDNATWSNTNWTNIDPQSYFSIDCSAILTYVPDNNFEQVLINLGYDTVLDDYVTTANINAVTSLNISNKNISDLTGIEGFTALITLHCNNNSLTSLDMSANTALETLLCYNNSLTSLNISANTALISLHCYTNSLTSLDVSANTDLILLLCNNNSLTSLDVSLNTVLETLYCQSNSLTSLNVANANNTNFINFDARFNSNLTCINVDNVAYSTTNWTNIDATASFSVSCGLTYVPDDNFEAYLEANGMGNGIANDDYVTTANINTVIVLNAWSQNISDLTGIEDFVALTSLSCNDNSLTTLDVSANTALTSLFCYDNLLTTLDVSVNTALEILWCHTNSLSSLDVTQNTTLTELDCGNNQLNILDVSANTALIRLYCYDNQLTSLNVANGNNINMPNIYFNATNNPNLICIEVDDVAYSTTNWTNIDTTASYSDDCACVLSIPDTNFKAYLVANAAINTNADTEIQCFEAIAFTGVIDAPSLNILDVTGIAAFINLTSLNVNFNSLASIDLSSNLALENFSCRGNALTSLELSNNTALSYLNCRNNVITDLHLTNNVALTTLICRANDLSSLNLKNGQNVLLSTMEAVDNANLLCIEVDDETAATAGSGVYAPWIKDATASYSEDCATYLAVDDFDLSQLIIFPNPTEGLLQIRTSEFALFSISDSRGRLIRNGTIDDDNISVDMSNLPQGIYFLTLEFEAFRTTRKIIKN